MELRGRPIAYIRCSRCCTGLRFRIWPTGHLLGLSKPLTCLPLIPHPAPRTTGTVALITALLKADPHFAAYDIRAHAFGTPACVSPELSVKLQPFVTSVIHREDLVPRLSFSNLVRLRSHFNRPEEKEW